VSEVNGYIVKHAVFGVGKIVEWSDLPRQPFRVRFSSADSSLKEVAFDKAVIGRQIQRTMLPPGSRCQSRRGPCVVVEILTFASDGAPAEYAVEYERDNGLRARAVESELGPVTIAVASDPGLILGGLQAGGYPIFRARERLSDVIYRMLRDGNGLRSLLSSRVDLRPHQAYVAGIVLLDRRRRYLLADEVGLGKTIEAGIVIADLIAQRPDSKVLILCPGALTEQWLCELYTKFSQTSFVMADLRGDQTDWANSTRVIVSMTRAVDSLSSITNLRWDLVIIDEVHHLLGSPVLYQLALSLSQTCGSLLLLSALPAQEREDEFLRLLTLLEPQKYSAVAPEDFASLFLAQQEVGRKTRLISRRLQDFRTGERDAADVLEKVSGLLELPVLADDCELGRLINLVTADPDRNTFSERVETLLHHVGDTYRINRRILRNRRSRLAQDDRITLITRRLHELSFIPEQLEIDAVQAVQVLLRSAGSAGATPHHLWQLARLLYQAAAHPPTLLSVLRRLTALTPSALPPNEDLLQASHLIGYSEWSQYESTLFHSTRGFLDGDLLRFAIEAAEAWTSDAANSTRIECAIEFLRTKMPKRESALTSKIIVFAGFPTLAADIAQRLQQEFGSESVGAFHHGLPREEKERQVNRFRTNSRMWLLMSDETGGEGRNFQFASEIFHFDLPWFASRIEQRIGRLDRLGRERERNPDVVSNVVYNKWAPEAGLVECYRDGLQVFSESLSGLEFALRGIEQSIAEASVTSGAEGIVRLVPTIQEHVRSERMRDESDALFDAASFERIAADKYWRVSDSSGTEVELEEAFIEYFRMVSSSGSVYRLPDDEGTEGVWQLTPADLQTLKLKLHCDPQTGVPPRRKGTFRRATAQLRPDIDFFTVGNELFDAVVRSMPEDGIGRTFAVECVVPGTAPWLGLEVVLEAVPQISAFANNAPGLANRARQLICTRPFHVFVSTGGKVADDTLGEALEVLRRSLNRENKGRLWSNLTKEKAQMLHRAFPGGTLQQGIISAQNQATEVARKHFTVRLGPEVDEEITRVKEMIRLALNNDKSPNEEIDLLNTYVRALPEWTVRIDAIGFLSVNGAIKP